MLLAKLIHGKVNLAEILHKQKQIQAVFPKINLLRRDVDHNSQQIDSLKAEAPDFMKTREVEHCINIIKRDLEALIEIEIGRCKKEFHLEIEAKLEFLKNLPNKDEYVR